MPLFNQTLFDTLLGPVPTEAAIRGINSTWNEAMSKLLYSAEIIWANTEVKLDPYYDRQQSFYRLYACTGDAVWLTRANEIAVNYRDVVRPIGADWFWSFPMGLALHYAVTGDEDSRDWVGAQANKAAYQSLNLGTGDFTNTDLRTHGRGREALIIGIAIDAPPHDFEAGIPPQDWDAGLAALRTQTLSYRHPDGAYRMGYEHDFREASATEADMLLNNRAKTFMHSLLAEVDILDLRLMGADARLPANIKAMADFLSESGTMWYDASAPQYPGYQVYNSRNTWKYVEADRWSQSPFQLAESTDPTLDLNLMTVPFLWWLTANGYGNSYKTQADIAFAHAVAVMQGGPGSQGGVTWENSGMGWLQSSKQFNENLLDIFKGAQRVIATTIGKQPGRFVGAKRGNKNIISFR
jgi:hypothetical protein